MAMDTEQKLVEVDPCQKPNLLCHNRHPLLAQLRSTSDYAHEDTPASDEISSVPASAFGVRCRSKGR